MSDRLLPIAEYMIFVYRPRVIEGDPNNREGKDHVIFRSKNPFPVPHVGDEIDREGTFNEHIGLTKRAIVTQVKHRIRESANELTCCISVYTAEE